MDLTYDKLWDLLRDVRNYARETGLRVLSEDNRTTRCFGFVTACPEEDPRARRWTIFISKVSTTAKRFENDLDGAPVTTDEQRELAWRYLHLLKDAAGRNLLAAHLSTGEHPSKATAEHFAHL